MQNYQNFFESHKNNASKIWQGIKNFVPFKNKIHATPTSFVYQHKTFNKNHEIADAFNKYFTNAVPDTAKPISKYN